MARVDLTFDLSNLTDLIDIDNDELATISRIVWELGRLAEPADGCGLVVQWSPSVLRVLTGLNAIEYDIRDVQDLFCRAVRLIHGASLTWSGSTAVLTVQRVIQS